jgi:hypothetical protein
VTGSVASSTASRTLSPEAALLMHWRRLQALAAAKVAGGYTEDELLKRFRRLGTRIWSKLDEKLGGEAARFAVGLPYLETPFLFPGPKWAPEKRASQDAAAAVAGAAARAAAPAEDSEAATAAFFFAAAVTARSDMTATPR